MEEALGLILEEFQRDPGHFHRYHPKVARCLERVRRTMDPPPLTLGYPALMDEERADRTKALEGALERFEREETMSREDAIAVIEDAAALGRHADLFHDRVVRVMQKVLGFPKDGPGPKSLGFRKDKPATRASRIARGITAYTSWDKCLVRLSCDPVEWEARTRLLSLIGMGHDEITDISVRHDEFLAEAYRE